MSKVWLVVAEAKVRDQRSTNPSNDNASELYCDDDISLKERLSRAEAVSQYHFEFTVMTPISPSGQRCIVSREL